MHWKLLNVFGGRLHLGERVCGVEGHGKVICVRGRVSGEIIKLCDTPDPIVVDPLYSDPHHFQWTALVYYACFENFRLSSAKSPNDLAEDHTNEP